MFFIIEKTLVLRKISILITDTLAKNFTKYLCIFFRFKTFCIFVSLKKVYILFDDWGVDSPPPRLQTGPQLIGFFTSSLSFPQLNYFYPFLSIFTLTWKVKHFNFKVCMIIVVRSIKNTFFLAVPFEYYILPVKLHVLHSFTMFFIFIIIFL